MSFISTVLANRLSLAQARARRMRHEGETLQLAKRREKSLIVSLGPMLALAQGADTLVKRADHLARPHPRAHHDLHLLLKVLLLTLTAVSRLLYQRLRGG